jgi:hypothetical protein
MEISLHFLFLVFGKKNIALLFKKSQVYMEHFLRQNKWKNN